MKKKLGKTILESCSDTPTMRNDCLSLSEYWPMPEQESPHSVQCPAANSGERSVVLESDRVGIGAVNDVSRKFIRRIFVS